MYRGLRQQGERGAAIVETECLKGTKILAVAYETGLAIAVCAESPMPHEVRLVQETLAKIVFTEPASRSGGIVTARKSTGHLLGSGISIA